MSVFSCSFRSEGESDVNLILCNSDVRQVGRLDAEVCHIDRAGRRSCNRVAHHLALHIKHLFVSLSMHGQVAGDLKMNGLPISIARW